jgi:hypothetical protein
MQMYCIGLLIWYTCWNKACIGNPMQCTVLVIHALYHITYSVGHNSTLGRKCVQRCSASPANWEVSFPLYTTAHVRVFSTVRNLGMIKLPKRQPRKIKRHHYATASDRSSPNDRFTGWIQAGRSDTQPEKLAWMAISKLIQLRKALRCNTLPAQVGGETRAGCLVTTRVQLTYWP